MGTKTYKLDSLPLVSNYGDYSDHKILVGPSDTVPKFLLNKISPDSLIKLVEDEDNVGKFKFIIKTYDNGSSSLDRGDLFRCISTVSIDQIDTVYNQTHSDTKSNLLIFPITISLGDIKSVGVYFQDKNDILSMDKFEIAIVSNTKNDIAGSKVEFAVSYYGLNNPNNTCRPGDDYKTLIVNTLEDQKLDPSLKVSDYLGIHDSTMNYRYVVMLIHTTDEKKNLLAKTTTNTIKLVGKNMNYCGRYENASSIYTPEEKGIIMSDTIPMRISDDCGIENNMSDPIPYIEFYQSRNLNSKNRMSTNENQ